jgi:hypothetical protein
VCVLGSPIDHLFDGSALATRCGIKNADVPLHPSSERIPGAFLGPQRGCTVCAGSAGLALDEPVAPVAADQRPIEPDVQSSTDRKPALVADTEPQSGLRSDGSQESTTQTAFAFFTQAAPATRVNAR